MKTYQKKRCKNFVSFLFIALSLTWNLSFADGVGERTKPVEISGLEFYRGANLTVLFVSAREAGFGMARSHDLAGPDFHSEQYFLSL